MVSTALLMMIYLSFISLGLPDSMLGSAWPAMNVSLNAPLWGAGLVQMLISFCTIISSLNSAKLIRKFGTGKLTAISVATTALALLGFSLAKNYAFLLLMAVPLGLGAGAVDAGLNNYVALHCEAKHMSWLHCFWGVGTIIGPMILSAVLRVGGSWATGYRVVGLIQCAVSALLFATLGMWKRGNIQQEEHGAKALSVWEVLSLPGAKAGMVTFLCYCAVESTLGLWGATYISQVRGVDEATAASFGAMLHRHYGRARDFRLYGDETPAQADGAGGTGAAGVGLHLHDDSGGKYTFGYWTGGMRTGLRADLSEHHTGYAGELRHGELAGGDRCTNGVCLCGFDLSAVHLWRAGRCGRIWLAAILCNRHLCVDDRALCDTEENR